MKRISIFGFAVFMAVALCACSEKQELINMSTIESSDYTAKRLSVFRNREPFCGIPLCIIITWLV